MGRKHKARNHSDMDANIIEFLMLEDSDVTASYIAQGIGMLRAADVTTRLNALHTKNIISKTKINKRVYWSIADNSPAAADDSVVTDNSTVAGNRNSVVAIDEFTSELCDNDNSPTKSIKRQGKHC